MANWTKVYHRLIRVKRAVVAFVLPRNVLGDCATRICLGPQPGGREGWRGCRVDLDLAMMLEGDMNLRRKWRFEIET